MIITGVSGLLGANLGIYFRHKFDVLGIYNTQPIIINGILTKQCNLLDSNNVNCILRTFLPDVIIHGAGLTNVDECELDKEKAYQMNVICTKNLVESISDHDPYMIYISSDSVYGGTKGNYSELDKIDPPNFYGISKCQGENETREYQNHLILRTNFFGKNILNKRNLAEWILNQLRNERPISGFKDAYFSSINIVKLAKIIDRTIDKHLTGTYNCGSIDSVSKYDFCLKIADRFGFPISLIKPISIDEFTFQAKRGKNLSLCINKLQKALDCSLPTIDDSIEAFFKNMVLNDLKAKREILYENNRVHRCKEILSYQHS